MAEIKGIISNGYPAANCNEGCQDLFLKTTLPEVLAACSSPVEEKNPRTPDEICLSFRRSPPPPTPTEIKID